MSDNALPASTHRLRTVPSAVLVAGLTCLLAALVLSFAGPARAATATVDLATAASYSVLGGQSVSNTGASTLAADLGVSPGTAITGFPPGVVGGAVHAADAAASQAQSDLTIAYNDAAGRSSSAAVAGDLVGRRLLPGVYRSTSTLSLTGTVTLDAQGDPAAVFIFQVASALTTFSASQVRTVNGTDPCHVFWQIGSSAILGTSSTFAGTVMALTSISVQTGAVVHGRALARNGSVTLDDDVFASPACNPAAASAAASAYSSSAAAASSSSAAAASSSSAAAASSSSAAAASSSSAAAASSSSAAAAANSSSAAAAANSSSAAANSSAALSSAASTGSLSGAGTSLANSGPRGPIATLLVLGTALVAFGLVLLAITRRTANPARRYVSAHRR
jgi:type VI secretion system secreted protein VgrG